MSILTLPIKYICNNWPCLYYVCCSLTQNGFSDLSTLFCGISSCFIDVEYRDHHYQLIITIQRTLFLYVIFPHILFIFLVQKNSPYKQHINILDVSFYCINCLDFLVLTHSIATMIISDNKNDKM